MACDLIANKRYTVHFTVTFVAPAQRISYTGNLDMDFLNPKKERRMRTMLLLGYALIALAIGIATLILLYISYGFSIDKKGNVTQSGLVFVSSQPTGSAIFLNGTRYKSATNTRMTLPAGSYNMQITAVGYRGWGRQITVAGNDVQHFDYPFLFPKTLSTTSITALTAAPNLSTQSPDKRWLLLGEADNNGKFLEEDLKTPSKPVQTEFSLPAGSFTPADGANAWESVEWASDSRHVLLLHSFTDGGKDAHEYILMDRDTPVDSINLTGTLKLTENDAVSLFNKKVDQFYIYDHSAQTLKRVSADNTTTLLQLDHVLAFKAHGDSMILYATDKPVSGKTANGDVSVVLQDGQKSTTLRTVPPGTTKYQLDLAQYSGDWYVVVAADTDTSAYLYKNPQDQARAANGLPVAWRRLVVAHPTFVGFSNSAQFVVAENAQEFAVYDAENIATYHYTTSLPLDQPQIHATWMDGDRMLYVSGSKLVVFDYDNRNVQTLQEASALYLPAFDPNYTYVFTLKDAAGDVKPNLTRTALTVPAK